MSGTRTESSIADLVDQARTGEEEAWAGLVCRYQSLVDSVTRRHHLSADDAADVSQNVWQLLLEHLGDLREPQALPGWIATTTARACLKALALQRRTVTFDPQESWELTGFGPDKGWTSVGGQAEPGEGLMRVESHRAVRRALAELTPTQRQLLLLVVADPPLSYRQISTRLGVPIGSIGPTRARLLRKLKRSNAVQELMGAGEGRANAVHAAA